MLAFLVALARPERTAVTTGIVDKDYLNDYERSVGDLPI